MSRRARAARMAVAVTSLALGAASVVAIRPSAAGADTDPSTLVGEGGSFLTPVTDLLLKTDTGLAPLSPSYNDANIDNAISDVVGSGPGSFTSDFAVSERPLTTAEAATAKANGRTFAYVPFAATPVAIAALAVCNPAAVAADSESAFCRNVQLTVPLIAALFTANLTSTSSTPNTGLFPALGGWNDPRVITAGGGGVSGAQGIYQASSLEPSAENTALLSLIDSDPTAREELDNALNTKSSDPQTTSDAPSETWPFHGIHAWVGGDAGLVGKELSINAETNAPAQISAWAGLGAGSGGGTGDVFPLSYVWSGSPEGTPWNVPTAAIQNAQGAFVPPSEAAAQASEAEATMDPATNLVAFNPNVTDATAYNSYLMVESYLVVPTTGLSAAKAAKLAQFIRYAVGPAAQSDEAALGSAPPTPAMVSADLKVASQLSSEASSSTATTSTTTTSKTGTTTSTVGAAATTSAGGSTSPDPSAAATGSTGANSSPGLAFTGAPTIVPIVGAGILLVVLGEVGRRKYRHQKVRT